LWFAPPASPDRVDNDLDREPDGDEIDDHLAVTTRRAASVLAVKSPNPTVEDTVTVKYSALVRVLVH